MTNKQAEVYFRQLSRGTEANSQIDMDAFLLRAEYNNKVEVEKEDSTDTPQFKILTGDGKETSLADLPRDKNVMIRIVDTTPHPLQPPPTPNSPE